MKTTKMILWGFVLLALTFTACSQSALEGDWDPMKWTAEESYQMVDGIFMVPQEGATFTFTCKNYSKPWVSDARQGGIYLRPQEPQPETPYDFNIIVGDTFRAEIHDNIFTVTFTPNTATSSRLVSITVTAGDIFYTFRFAYRNP